MAADLHIHIFEGVTEGDLASFFSHTLGSKWCPLGQPDWNPRSFLPSRTEEASRRVEKTPSIHVGEVSWLKAAFLDDAESFIPATVGAISEIIGEELPVIDDELISKIMGAYDVPNQTDYYLSPPEEVLAFLEHHRGKRVFTVSW